jgi:hypothetical protein
VYPVRCELGFISQKTRFFIVTDVKTSSLTLGKLIALKLLTKQMYSHQFLGIMMQVTNM